ncbi:hypothetical protein AG0111_0g4954 [Alternaria gaisen]|uniref:Uncharacterized protein n=1 Tax=Alternaria gaisen TaxID=167740 RepID=A0ACB6FPK4_9PLEO|nr:hypothetical protein AG0111_0g4954 [Alternaria gaisen]
MQTLTIPASVSKRKQACKNCRQRKKRCDLESPDLIQFPSARLPTSVALSIPYPTPASAVEQLDDTLDFQTLDSFQLPPQNVIFQLVELFFEHLYHTFPCFHRKSFLAKLERGDLEKDAPLLLYAICCVAARHHLEQSIQKRSRDWYEQARFSYELTRRRPEHPLRTVQAVLLLVFHAWTIGDYSASWLFLGKIWRQAVVLGLNRMDAIDHLLDARVDNENSCAFGKTEAHSAVEREEYRRALWLLFMMDRMNAWPLGWPNAIPEIQFKVDIPIADTLFQNIDPDLRVTSFNNLPFTRNLSRLIDSVQAANGPLNILHYVIVAHILLGRVSELLYSLHRPSDSLEYAADCTELDDMIVKFRLSLPRPASSILEAPPADRGHVAWLHIILETMAILLHYQCNTSLSVQEAASKFTLAVIAARNVAQLVKDASRMSIDLLLSAHIGSSLYMAACVLVIQWRLTGDSSFKEDIDLFKLVFERMDEVFSFLGLKLKIALEHDMQKSVAELQNLRERGFKGMLADCTKWDHVKQEIDRRGIRVDLS